MINDNTTARPWAVLPMGFNVSTSGLIIPGIGAEVHPYADVIAKVGVIGPQRTAAQVWADANLIVRAVNANDELVTAAALALHKIEQTLTGQYADGAALRATLDPLRAALAKAGV